MTKKLRIRFVKFNRALAMQILEQTGKFEDSEHVRIDKSPAFFRSTIYLRGNDSDLHLRPDFFLFSNNSARDKHLSQVINWITEEQFTSGAWGLKVGEMCEVGVSDAWEARKLLAILPKRCGFRFIFESEATDGWACADRARPLAKRVEPKIDGDVYTWEMEVAE